MKSRLSLRIFSTTLMVLLSFNAVAPALAEAANNATSSSTASSQTVVLPAADDAAAIPEAKKSADQKVAEEPQTPNPEETQTTPDPGVVDPVAKRDNAGAQPKEHVGEYNVDEFSGAFNYSYPITIPAGRNNLQPQVALNYNHQRVNIGSFVGFGWDIPMPAVERQARTGVDKLYSDNYFSLNLSGNADLEPISVDANGYGTYGKKIEDDFSKIEYSASVWIVTDKMGTKYTFGADTASRQDNPADSTKVYRWMLTEIRDTNDNYVRYEYYKDSGQIYPKKIFYTGNGSTDGIYEVDFQPFASGTPTEDNLTSVSYKTGFAVQTKYLLHRIEVKVKGVVTSAYDLTYTLNQGGLKKLLTAIQPRAYQAGQEYSKDRVDLIYGTRNTSFTESSEYALPSGRALAGTVSPGQTTDRNMFVDVTHDGLVDNIYISCTGTGLTMEVYKNNGHGGWSADVSRTIIAATSCDPHKAIPLYFGEVNGDHKIDVITQNSYYLNTDSGWQQTSTTLPVTLAQPLGHTLTSSVSFMDMNGDGYDDLVYNDNSVNNSSVIQVYMRIPGGGWAINHAYDVSVTAYNGDCFTYGGSPYGFNDLNADGQVDIFSNYFCRMIGTQESQSAVYLNSGSGLVSSTQFVAPATMSNFDMLGGSNQTTTFVTDIDGDGLEDNVSFSRSYEVNNNSQPYSQGQLYANGILLFDTGLLNNSGYWQMGIPIAISDFNGDGVQDIMYSWGPYDMYYGKANRPDILKSIQYQSGGEIYTNYANSAHENNQYLQNNNSNLPFNLLVAKDVVISDGNSLSGSHYDYANGNIASYPSEKIRDIYGFGTVTAISGKAAAVTDGQGQTHYSVLNVTNDPTRSTRQTTYQIATGNLTSLDPSYYLHGKPLTTQMYDSTNRQVSQSYSQWSNQSLDAKRSFSSLSSQAQSSWPTISSTPSPSSHTLAQYHLDGPLGSSSKLVNSTGNSNHNLQLVNILDSDVGYNNTTDGAFRSTVGANKGLIAPGFETITTGSFSIEMWIKHLGTTSAYKPFGKIDNNDYGTYAEFDADKSIHWYSGHDSYTWNVKTPANSITLGEWHHYAFTTDTTTAKIYIDGVLSAQGAITPNYVFVETAPINFFCASCGNNSSGPFIIDEIRISDIARTADQLFNDNPLYTPDETPVSQAKQYSYDSANGNIVTESDLGLVSANLTTGTFTDITGDEKTTSYAYASNGTKHILAAPKTKTVAGLGESKPEDFYYDQQSFGNVDKANVTKEDLKSNTVDIETTYNNFGLPLTKKDPKDNTAATLSYDSDNMFVATSTDALGRSTVTKTDPITGQLLYSRDPNGYQEKYSYDAWGRLTKKEVSDPANVATLITKQEVSYGDVTNPRYREIKDYFSAGHYTTTREYYDGLGRVIQTSSLAAGNQYVTTYKQYDGQGRLVKESLPTFTASADFNTSPSFTNAKVTTYDAQGRPLTETTPTGTTSYAYDGLVTTITDPRGKVKKLTNDAFGNLVQVDEFNNGSTYTTNYEYSLTNKLKKITDALGNIRTFTYDALDNLTQQDMVHTAGTTNPGHWTYTYDKNGNVLSKVDLKSQTTNYSYDALNRLLTENFTGKTGTEYTMTYDQGTKQLGRLTRVVGSDGLTTVYTYDPQGKPLTVVRTIDGTSYTLTYAYDWNGNVTSITYPEGERIDYLYNAVGQINQVNKVKNGTTTVLASGVTYTPMGQIAHLQRGNNVTTDYTYDANQNYRLTRIRTVSGAVVLQDIAYTYDANGNILTIVDSSQTALAKNVAYGYDDLNRLTSAIVTNSGSGANYSHTYSYDAIGNILSSTPVGNYTYTLSNPHQARTAGSTTLTYDNNGNVVYINQDHQSYDWRDRMTYSAVAGSSDHTEYVYDHANQRVKKHTLVYVPAGGGVDCETHPDQCPDPIFGIPRELPPVVTPPPGKLPMPIEVIVPTPDQEGQVLSPNTEILNNTEIQSSNNQEIGNLELGIGAEVTAETVETESTSTAPILTVEPVEPLPIGIFEVPTSTPETVATSTDPVVLPEPVVIEPLPSMEDVATTTDQSVLSLENPTPDAAPSASDHVTYYIDKYYEKEWNGVARNHYFLGNINLAVEPLSGPNSGIYYVLSDHLGSSSLTTNSYGNMIDRTEYTPYGAIVATASTQDIGNKYKFTGKELDGETNLSYFGARYYNQVVGRFMAVDPATLLDPRKLLKDPQLLNGYTYTRNNPIILIDPSGELVELVFRRIDIPKIAGLQGVHIFIRISNTEADISKLGQNVDKSKLTLGGYPNKNVITGDLMKGVNNSDDLGTTDNASDKRFVYSSVIDKPDQYKSQKDFEQAIIDTYGNLPDDNGKYSALSIGSQRNSNNFSSTVLQGAGVSSEKLRDIRNQVPGGSIIPGYNENLNSPTWKSRVVEVQNSVRQFIGSITSKFNYNI